MCRTVWRLSMVIVASTPALAHDHWISRENLSDPVTHSVCCGEGDCEDLGDQGIAVRERGATFVLGDSGEQIEKNRVLWRSPNGHWWRCGYDAREVDGSQHTVTRCLIGPPNPF
ncbi:MAG TPA: hypothetical protein VK281_03045 [Xanthobacteraceae bacterium]|nr:hypothetical protein [Xanthobacteraceae bacterium]